jgi:hypothetical protein
MERNAYSRQPKTGGIFLTFRSLPHHEFPQSGAKEKFWPAPIDPGKEL